MRIQFILKRNLNYNFVSYCRRSSGLWNSTRFIVESLQSRGIEAEIVEVHDGNDVDREVTRFNPDVVVVEALWVTPHKFNELVRLHRHRNRRWFCHMHSGVPFLAQEGIAMDWLSRYPHVGVGVIANSPESFEAFKAILPEESVTFLPNVYLSRPLRPVRRHPHHEIINVGCFGAIRPMKNQLLQAMAAIQFANERGRRLRFHINASRIEVGGAPVLKNLVQLFEQQPEHELVQHHWMEPEEFIHFLHHHIDIGMQVSLTETFNVVTADYVTAGIPVVVSKEIKWASRFNRASDDDINDIVRIMDRAYGWRCLIDWNQQLLQWNSWEAQEAWAGFCLSFQSSP